MISSSWIGFEPPILQLTLLLGVEGGLTDETGVTALRNDGDIIIIAVFHDLRHLLCRAGFNDNLRFTMILVQPIVVVRRELVP